ncbi:phenylacetate--CoA ligase family protein [Magnetococcales bacterium HHB-1]
MTDPQHTTQWYTHNNQVTLLPYGQEPLHHFLIQLHQNSLYYRSLLEKTGFRVPFNQNIPQLWNQLPPTEKQHYRDILQAEALQKINKTPFFVCDHSSGSTAQAVLRYSAPQDELAEQKITEIVFHRTGFTPEDRFICMDVGASEIYDFYFRAARTLGVSQCAFVHLTGRYQKSVAPLKDLAPTIILTIPSLLIRIWPHIRDFWPRHKAPIKTIIHMGEALHPALKKEIESHWRCKIFSFYGTTETGGMAGECHHQNGCHYDPLLTPITLLNPKKEDQYTYTGEALITTNHFTTQPVLKYRVGDHLRITNAPCPCGEPTPRLTFIERTNDSFLVAGVKFRHQMILDALRHIDEEIRYLSIILEDISEKEGNTRLTFRLAEPFAPLKEKLQHTLETEVFDMDVLHRLGLLKIQLEFIPETQFGERKIRKVHDQRQFLGQ